MSNINIDLDELDDYINTFKLKNFDDSDDEIANNVFRNDNKVFGSDLGENKQGINVNLGNQNLRNIENLNEKEKSGEIVEINKEKEKFIEIKPNLFKTNQAEEISIFDKMRDDSCNSKEYNHVHKTQEDIKQEKKTIFDEISDDEDSIFTTKPKEAPKKENNIFKPDNIKNTTNNTRSNDNPYNPSGKPFENKKCQDPFSKIYDNFEDVFNKKVEIPSKDFLEKEILKLKIETEEILLKKSEIVEEKPKTNHFEIKTKVPNNVQNYQSSIQKNNPENKLKEILNEPEIIKEIKGTKNLQEGDQLIQSDKRDYNTFKEEGISNAGEEMERNKNEIKQIETQSPKILKENKSTSHYDQKIINNKHKSNGYFDKNNFIYLNQNNQNRFHLIEIHKRFKDLNNTVEKEYFPINYSEKLETEKFKNLFLNLKSKIIERQIPHVKLPDFILISLIHSFLEGNMKSSLLTDSNARREFVKDLKLSSLKNDYIINISESLSKISYNNDTSKRLFKDESENLLQNFNLENIIQSSMEKFLSDSYKDKNFRNLMLLSVFGKQEDIFNYLLETFNDNPELKDSEFYILFMIRSGQIKQLISEQKDYLYKNFYSILIILLENLEYFYDVNVHLFFETMLKSDSKNKTYDKFLVLKLITNSFSLENSKYYTDSLTEYLHFTDSFRLLISDFLNYLVFTKLPDSEKAKLSVVGYCSILIKFKYVLLKTQSNSMNPSLKDYGERIVQNIRQFGKYSQDLNFLNYLKELISRDTKKENIEKTIRKESEASASLSDVQSQQFNKEISKQEVGRNKETVLSNRKQENGGGITSFIVSALGFGSGPNQKKEEKVEEVKKEEEIVPEIYYDTVKKRWVLKGKIYDDEEQTKDPQDNGKVYDNDIKQNKNIFEDNNKNTSASLHSTKLKPTILPPKVKLNRPNLPNVIEQSQIIQNKSQIVIAQPTNTKEQDINSDNIKTNITSNSNPFIQTNVNSTPSSNNKPNVINNPFLAVKKEPATQQFHNVRPPPRINMTNRYASILDQNK